MRSIIILASLCAVTLALTREDLLVTTKVGQIRGLRDEKGYSKFLGIPYGKVGNNIFGVAEPYPAFEDVFEAYDVSNVCPQVSFNEPVGTIDCLHLNIYVPDNADANHPLPVMIWIHGGAFIGGNTLTHSSDPYSLLRHDVIVVGVNYRLGIFGFMCLDIPEVPGNTGLKDQVIALRWIKENIEAFGGDPNQITLFGESAGGMSTNLHLFSPHEKLFDRAIIQSGTANSYWVIVESDNTIPIRIAGELGLNTTNIYEALDFLEEFDVQSIALVGNRLLISNAAGTNQPLTKPCVEQKFEGVDQFLTEHPINIISEKAITTPVIIGYNNVEFAFQYAFVDGEFFDTYHFSQHLAKGFHSNEDITDSINFVKHFYIGDEDISEKVRWEIIDFASDFIFKHPSQRMAKKLVDDGATSVYTYVFSYNGNFWVGMNKTWVGATHGEELQYLFDLEHLIGDKSPEDQLVIDRMTEMWTNFVKYGDPTPVTSELVPVKWTPITKTTQPYLALDSDLKLENRPFNDRMAFWDMFYDEYGHYQKWYKADPVYYD